MNCGSACFPDGHGLELLHMMSLPFAGHMAHSWNTCPTNEMADDVRRKLTVFSVLRVKTS